MAQYKGPSSRSFAGPWFIDAEALEKLETIAEETSKKLKVLFEAEERESYKKYKTEDSDVEAAVKKSLEEKIPISVVVNCAGGKTLHDHSISGILKDSKIDDVSVQRLRIEVNYSHRIRVVITVNDYGKASYDIDLSDNSVADDVAYSINSWVEKYQSGKILQWWSNNGFTIAFGTFLAMVALLLISFEGNSSDTTENLEMKKELSEILKQGVTKESEPKAIELLLKYELGHYWIKSPSKPQFKSVYAYFSFYWLETFLLSIIMLLGAYSPFTIIGIGKNKSRMKFWKSYAQLFAITIPGFILLAIARKFITELL